VAWLKGKNFLYFFPQRQARLAQCRVVLFDFLIGYLFSAPECLADQGRSMLVPSKPANGLMMNSKSLTVPFVLPLVVVITDA
jgi:hypothetical protein